MRQPDKHAFKEGTTRSRVDEINAEIGASVVYAPAVATTYRIQLPAGWCYQRGIEFYKAKAEVISATQGINICFRTRRPGPRGYVARSGTRLTSMSAERPAAT